MDAPLCVGKPGIAARTHDWRPCKITKGGLVCVCTVPRYEKLVHARLMAKQFSFFYLSIRLCSNAEWGSTRDPTSELQRSLIPQLISLTLVSTFGRNLTCILPCVVA
jgi:hypothetical protein